MSSRKRSRPSSGFTEARGDNKEAADCYRKVIALVDEHPDGYDPEFLDTFRDLVERLDLPAPPAAT